MIVRNSFVLSALLALGGVRSCFEALAEDPARAPVRGSFGLGDLGPAAEADREPGRKLRTAQPLPRSCVNAAGAKANLTHNFCFEDCEVYHTPGQIPASVPNLANSSSNSFKDDVVQYPVGYVICGPEGMYLQDSNPWIRGSPALPGEATVAVVVKHGPRQTGSTWIFDRMSVIQIRGYQFPTLMLSVWDATAPEGTTATRILLYNDVWSSIEFVSLVVTISNTKITVYRNGAALAESSGGPATINDGVRAGQSSGAFSGITRLGLNNLGSTIKSVAMWTRALSAEEVAGLQVPPPTESPTSSPTESPTSSPTQDKGEERWDIAFVNMTADFSGAQSSNELIAVYEVSKDRAHDVFIFASRCDAAEGSEEDVTPGVIVVNMTSSGKDDDWDMLTLAYDFDEALLGSSNVWNQTSGMIEFCQRLRLVLGDMVIAEDVRQFGVNLTLDGRFNFTNFLGPETVEEADKSSSLGALNVFKCDGLSFNPDPSPLRPNGYLIICIKYLLDGVEIDSLDSMIIDQAGIATFEVINGDAAVFPSLSSMMYTQDAEVLVTTRLPINSFDFEAPDASISVSGNAALKLADGSRRLLQGDVGAGIPDDRAPDAEFELEVKLAKVGVEGDEHVMSPAGGLSGTVLPVLAALFTLAWVRFV